ncbi:hypothetical protein PT974_10863 [Cladobotryum mycophilum]|uniref:SMP domain-containing protein n=1 Tax=Cladobotryum mycophilum TaxID=491253 RepID=A0ABR0SC45_9HYPO
MSGTAPSDSAPGDGTKDVEQRDVGANQQGQAQNMIDETKDTHGSAVGHNIGEAIDAVKAGGGLPARVDDIMNPSSIGSETIGEEMEGKPVSEQRQ